MGSSPLDKHGKQSNRYNRVPEAIFEQIDQHICSFPAMSSTPGTRTIIRSICVKAISSKNAPPLPWEIRVWDDLLPYLLFAYHEVPQASTGFAPFELVYGRSVRGPRDIVGKQVLKAPRVLSHTFHSSRIVLPHWETWWRQISKPHKKCRKGDMIKMHVPGHLTQETKY